MEQGQVEKVTITFFLIMLGVLKKEQKIHFVQKDINMMSGREGICKYDVFFTKSSDFDQYVSNVQKTSMPLSKFFFNKYPDSSTPHLQSIAQ